MECEAAMERLWALIDGELGEEERAGVEAHVGRCAACGRALEGLRGLDARLRSAVEPGRRAAGEVSRRVMARLAPGRARLSGWRLAAGLALSAGAGFAAAWLLRTGPGRTSGSIERPALAELTLATGLIEASEAEGVWSVLPTGGAIRAGARVRTGPAWRCEFRTADGSEIRLDTDTEFRFAAGREFELPRGRVWSTVKRAAAPFSVRFALARVTALGTQFDVRAENGRGEVMVVEGATRVTAGGVEQRVEAGEALAVVDGRLGEKQRVDDLVSATRWVHEILVLKGRDNPELLARVNDLLAQIGETKMDFVYEQEMRWLGDSCVLPLTRYIQSPRSQPDESKRHRAARILSDIAQPWSVPDLIELLNDEDGEIRYFAARGLSRLTGQDFGRTAESWRDHGVVACEDTLERWREWWKRNEQRFPRAARDGP